MGTFYFKNLVEKYILALLFVKENSFLYAYLFFLEISLYILG